MNCIPVMATRQGIFCTAMILAAAPHVLAQSGAQGPTPPLQIADTGQIQPITIVYTPPRRGMPTRRASAATRTTDAGAAFVSVLAPETLGLTTQSQPTLYWYLSSTADRRVVITVIDEESIDPVLEITKAAPETPGLQVLDLAELGVRLEPGREYEWEVALIDDADNRYQDVYSRGAIERIDPPSGIAQALDGRSPLERAKVLAEAGIWYDAIDELSRAVAASPDTTSIQSQWRSLLTQVKLDEVAASLK